MNNLTCQYYSTAPSRGLAKPGGQRIELCSDSINLLDLEQPDDSGAEGWEAYYQQSDDHANMPRLNYGIFPVGGRGT